MSAFRVTRLGSIAKLGLLLTLFPSLAHAQAPTDAASSPASAAPTAASESAAPAAVAPAPEPAPAPAGSSAVAVPAAAPANASTREDAKAEAAAEAAASAAATEAASSHSSNEDIDQVQLHLYGFADFNYAFGLGSGVSFQNPSFAIGKLNLYAAADLGENSRSLMEVRFMYLPNGSTGAFDPTSGSTAPARTNTTVGDYTDLNRPMQWGGISIERAWLEHTFYPALTVRMGAFLTPYGIWNVDHGSPVIITTRRPFIIGEGLFPEHQTGFEIYGAWNLGPSQVGYHVTLSNGRGPLDTYQDLDHNKAIGGRLFFKHDSPNWGTLTLGASGYKGTYTDSQTSIGVDSTGKLGVTTAVTSQYKELSLAADIKWELGGLLVQSELIMHDIAYPDEHRPTAAPLAGGPSGFVPDHRGIGGYGFTGYRFPFLGTMPFGGLEFYDSGDLNSTAPVAAAFGGLNVRPTARIVFKGQYTYSWFGEWQGPKMGHYSEIELQTAWSF